MITTEKTAYAGRLAALSCPVCCIVKDDKARGRHIIILFAYI